MSRKKNTRHTIAKRTAAKHPNINIRGNTPVLSKVEVLDVSSNQSNPLSSPIFENQLGYFMYQAAKHGNINGTTLDNASKLVLLDENIKD